MLFVPLNPQQGFFQTKQFNLSLICALFVKRSPEDFLQNIIYFAVIPFHTKHQIGTKMISVKKLAFTAFAAAYFGLGGISGQTAVAKEPSSTKPDITIEELVRSHGEFRCCDKLAVNQTDVRQIVPQNEEEGIQDMRKLVSSSPLEEAWVYLPKDELWVEIGKKSRPPGMCIEQEFRFFQLTTVLDVEFMHDLPSAGYDEIIVYHFHPDSNFKSIENAAKRLKKRHRSSVFTRQMYVLNKINPKGEVAYKICSCYGVAEFYLTEKGKAHFNQVFLLEKERDFLVKGRTEINIISCNANLRLFEFAGFNKGYTESAAKELAGLMSSEYIRITFTPYDATPQTPSLPTPIT
jgi:hypothetical protein